MANTITIDALRQVLSEFSFEAKVEIPSDPDSAEYREAQMTLYRRVSGRATYAAEVSEMFEIDLKMETDRPFPYSTRSSLTVGEQLMAIGFLLMGYQLAGYFTEQTL